MKRMNNLKNVIAAKIMGGLVIGMAAVAGVSPVTVFAQSQEAECICDEKCSQDSINEECAVCLYDYNVCQGVDAHIEDSEECTETAEENYGPLTPDGNMNLVDDYGSIEVGGKQFITVTTKSGNYFYIIIDRDDKGTETVHLKLMEDDEVESYMNSQGMTASEKEKEEVKSTEATEEISEEPKEEAKALETGKKKNVTGIMALVLIAAIGGIGGFMYMKSNKGKKKADAPDPDADYFDSDDDEDYLADMDIEEESVSDQDTDEDISMEEDIQMDEADEE